MVTAERTLPWDAYLGEYADQQGWKDNPSREAYLRNLRAQIEVFRQQDWKKARRDFQSEYGIRIPDELEPHWVCPGRMIMYQEQIYSRAAVVTDEGGNPSWERQELNDGFKPSSHISLNGASGLYRALRKGLRLRPHIDILSVDAEALSPALPEAAPEETRQTWLCKRHGVDQYRMLTWKSYLQHCRAYIEPIEFDLPENLAELAKNHKYFCMPCGTGFPNYRSADRHMRYMKRRPGRSQHPTVQEMHKVVANQQEENGTQ